MKMLKTLLAIALLIISCLNVAEAKNNSYTIRVSCTVPERLELSLPIQTQEKTEEQEFENSIHEKAPEKIQTEQIKIQGNQRTIVYTIVER